MSLGELVFIPREICFVLLNVDAASYDPCRARLAKEGVGLSHILAFTSFGEEDLGDIRPVPCYLGEVRLQGLPSLRAAWTSDGRFILDLIRARIMSEHRGDFHQFMRIVVQGPQNRLVTLAEVLLHNPSADTEAVRRALTEEGYVVIKGGVVVSS